MNFDVKWSPEMSDYYKHGSTVEYLDGKKAVFFKNNMLSPGASVAKWVSNPNYQGDRGFMQLPLLEKGKSYYISLQAKASPNPSPLIKITFYNRVEEVIGIQLVKESKEEFVYPMKAYTYSIEILNNGIKELFFRKIGITSNREGEASK